MTRKTLLPLALLFASLFLIGCETTSSKGAATEWQSFEGKVVYVAKYRGFWGIETRHQGRINPISLPEEFRVDNLRITGEVILRPDYASAKKWGVVGEVRNLEVVP